MDNTIDIVFVVTLIVGVILGSIYFSLFSIGLEKIVTSWIFLECVVILSRITIRLFTGEKPIVPNNLHWKDN